MVFRQSLYGSSSLQTNPSGSLAFVTVLFLRCIAIPCAFIQIYFPDGVLLRLISRESVA